MVGYPRIYYDNYDFIDMGEGIEANTPYSTNFISSYSEGAWYEVDTDNPLVNIHRNLRSIQLIRLSGEVWEIQYPTTPVDRTPPLTPPQREVLDILRDDLANTWATEKSIYNTLITLRPHSWDSDVTVRNREIIYISPFTYTKDASIAIIITTKYVEGRYVVTVEIQLWEGTGSPCPIDDRPEDCTTIQVLSLPIVNGKVDASPLSQYLAHSKYKLPPHIRKLSTKVHT